MLRRIVVGSAMLALLLLVAGVGFATPANSGQIVPSETHQEDAFDRTTFEITVFDDGTAQWTVRHSRVLDGDDEVEEFETFAEEFRTEELEVYENFQVRGERLTESGTDATDREMAATDFQRDAFVAEGFQPEGVIEMSFNWTNFAVVNEPGDNGTQVVVADVFAGGWTIVDGQQLVVRAGPDLVFESVTPEDQAIFEVEDDLTASQTVTWEGYLEFTNNRPRVVLTPADELTDESGTTDESEASDEESDTDESQVDGEDDEDNGSGVSLLAIVVGFLILVAAGGGFAWYRGALPRETGATAASEAGTVNTATGDVPEGEQEPPVPETEILSDEDHVLNLLEENGGRMKQVAIVEETDWSKSKVSMLLSEMEDDGEISKLRVGRENIISIAGQEPEAARSPFEDET